MTWLFIWNPMRFSWDNAEYGYKELRSDIIQGVKPCIKWSCGSTKRIAKGDRIFLIRLGWGVEWRGIVASGHAMTPVFEGTHWDPEKATKGKTVRRVFIEFDKITDIDKEQGIAYNELEMLDSGFRWSPMSSGVSIPDNVAEKLEAIWKNT